MDVPHMPIATERRSVHLPALALISTLVLLSVGALYGGISFLLDPSGALIGMSPDFIDGLFIPDYVLPGWILTIGFGIAPLVAAYGLWRRPSWSQLEWLERWTGMHWSWVITLAVGLGQMLWVLVEFAMTSYYVLQPVMFAVGAVIVVLTMLPSVRASYRPASSSAPDT